MESKHLDANIIAALDAHIKSECDRLAYLLPRDGLFLHLEFSRKYVSYEGAKFDQGWMAHIGMSYGHGKSADSAVIDAVREWKKDHAKLLEQDRFQRWKAKNPAKTSDPDLEEAIEVSIESAQVSVSKLQRSMGVGYARASSLISQMVVAGAITKDGETNLYLVNQDEARKLIEKMRAEFSDKSE